MELKLSLIHICVSDEQYFAKIIKEDRPRVIQAYRDLADGKIEKVKEEYRVLANEMCIRDSWNTARHLVL